MTENEVFNLLLARRDNYGVSSIEPISGRAYSVVMNGRRYNAIVTVASFDFYQMRYHLAKQVPSLIICFQHDTVVPVACLSLKAGQLGIPYALPAHIKNVEAQRHRSKTGSQTLLGMYLCGMRAAQELVNKLPARSKRRYLEKARELSKRKPGRPVNSIKEQTR